MSVDGGIVVVVVEQMRDDMRCEHRWEVCVVCDDAPEQGRPDRSQGRGQMVRAFFCRYSLPIMKGECSCVNQ